MSEFLSISALARRFGLSRGALLHYDRVGLLAAGSRSPSGYRRYGPGEVARLQRILELRAAGLPLDEIKEALAASTPLDDLLARQLAALSTRMATLRDQQAATLRLLRAARVPDQHLNKASWSALLSEAGLSDEDMRRWHQDFEARLPEAHGDFLAFLGLDADEIASIRSWSRGAAPSA